MQAAGDAQELQQSGRRYADSIESLVRNNIQKMKIDMANEVIDAGRFDMNTSMEERKQSLESLLQVCAHPVTSLSTAVEPPVVIRNSLGIGTPSTEQAGATMHHPMQPQEVCHISWTLMVSMHDDCKVSWRMASVLCVDLTQDGPWDRLCESGQTCPSAEPLQAGRECCPPQCSGARTLDITSMTTGQASRSTTRLAWITSSTARY